MTITDKPYYNTHRSRTRNQLNIEYWFTKDLSLKLRYEDIISKRQDQQNKSKGNLFYIQMKSVFFDFLTSIFRVTFYNTDDHDSAVYALENQLPYWYNGIDSYSLISNEFLVSSL